MTMPATVLIAALQDESAKIKRGLIRTHSSRAIVLGRIYWTKAATVVAGFLFLLT
jgi:hypothetical protein